VNILRAAIIAWKSGLRTGDIWDWTCKHYNLYDRLHVKALYMLTDDEIIYYVRDYVNWKRNH
jgi:hypothetical protein